MVPRSKVPGASTASWEPQPKGYVVEKNPPRLETKNGSYEESSSPPIVGIGLTEKPRPRRGASIASSSATSSEIVENLEEVELVKYGVDAMEYVEEDRSISTPPEMGWKGEGVAQGTDVAEGNGWYRANWTGSAIVAGIEAVDGV